MAIMISVVIADDHGIVREGLQALIASAPEMEVVAEAEDGDEALDQTLTHRPDVLLMDMSMQGRSGLQLIEAVRRRVPETGVLVLTMHREEQYAIRSIQAGAHGFITKTRPPAELLEALRQVARGQLYITAELAHRLAHQALTGRPDGQPHTQLTQREHEVFMALVQGLTVGAIAAQLHLSSKTVSTHKARIFRKLGVDNLSGLVRYALTNDLL